MMENYKHTTVLLDEAVNGLNIRPDGIYIDGTFGRGGHSRLILSQLGEEGRLLAIDRDPQAIAVAKTIDDPRFSIIHGPFSALGEYVAERDLIGKIDGILLDLGVSAATPVKDKFKHPATRTFQAVRIWVNSELEEIEQALKSSLNVLAPGGRLSIISFHSLEDRIVKRFMRENSRGPQVPAGLPMTEEQLKKLGGRQLRALGKLMPGEEEVAENPRARSSVLRIAERTNA